MFLKIYALLSPILTIFTVVGFDWINSPYDFWIPILTGLVIFFCLCVFHLLLLLIISCIIDTKKPIERPSKFCKFLLDYTIELVLALAKVKIEVKGIEKIPTDTRFLLVSNHRSGFDPFVTIVKTKRFGISYVSKPENFKIIVAGSFMRRCGFLSIDRENARNAMKTIHKATDLVKKNIASVAIYPEGTRSKTCELLEFKDGVFYVAKKAECPIVIITVKGTEMIAKNFPFKKTKVTIDVLSVLEPQSFSEKTSHEISDEVRQIMLENL